MFLFTDQRFTQVHELGHEVQHREKRLLVLAALLHDDARQHSELLVLRLADRDQPHEHDQRQEAGQLHSLRGACHLHSCRLVRGVRPSAGGSHDRPKHDPHGRGPAQYEGQRARPQSQLRGQPDGSYQRHWDLHGNSDALHRWDSYAKPNTERVEGCLLDYFCRFHGHELDIRHLGRRRGPVLERSRLSAEGEGRSKGEEGQGEHRTVICECQVNSSAEQTIFLKLFYLRRFILEFLRA